MLFSIRVLFLILFFLVVYDWLWQLSLIALFCIFSSQFHHSCCPSVRRFSTTRPNDFQNFLCHALLSFVFNCICTLLSTIVSNYTWYIFFSVSSSVVIFVAIRVNLLFFPVTNFNKLSLFPLTLSESLNFNWWIYKFYLSFAVCNQFSRGVFSMLGAVSPESFDTLHSYSNTFQMPFVTPWFPEKVMHKRLHKWIKKKLFNLVFRIFV